MNLSIISLFLFLLFSFLADGARILAVFSFCNHSHFWLGFRLVQELAKRGHEVTFINCFPQKTPIKNLRDVSVAETKDAIKEKLSELVDFGQKSYWGQLEFMNEVGIIYTKEVFSSPNVQNLLQSNEEFDLVLLEHFMNDAMVYFHHRFNCPLVFSAPGPSSVLNNHLSANFAPPSYVPNLLSDHDSKMDFWERLTNTYLDVVGGINIHYSAIPNQAALLKEFFPTAPPLDDMLYNASLIFTSSHVSLYGPAPSQQNVKQIGGYHVPPVNPLPKEMKEFLDNATEGVVIFSMGSNLQASHFEEDKKNAIFKTFSKLKQKVLWKFEINYPEISNNVKILSWIPQNDVLAHPNVVAFISHGGLLGTMEALNHGVPILGLPVYWDQMKNIADAARRGFALRLDYKNLNEHNFQRLLTEILTDANYRQSAKKQSRIFHDQPVKQIDEAMFWLEYVIRHKGAPHLMTAAIKLKWYQLHLLDIYLFIATIMSVSVFIIYITAKKYSISSGEKIDLRNKTK
ncbi:unnamed protein product [Phaedon cochleariae]|uniref:UDP-glucuronosyltransferase n=1 Tax=Phaedon cochleariae TaxID=80249 RepID=A0A9P0DNN1_PHACE|nr:unnamed protein product [Phaedon cochleariae]